MVLVICRSQDSVEVVVFDGDPEKTTAMVMNYFRSRSCSHNPATIWCNFWKYKKGRHLANVSDKDFFRLNIIGPPTEEQAAPQKVDLNIFTGNRQWSSKSKSCLRYQVVKFSGVDSDKSYTVRVSLLLNGKSIATAQKSLKALAKVQPEIQVDAA